MVDEQPRAGSKPRRSQRAVAGALVIDNLGSGLFLPLTIVYAVKDIGLSVGAAGSLLTLGTLAGLFAPTVVGRLGARWRAAQVVTISMLIQAAGMATYAFAKGPAMTIVAAALVAAGTQTFYSSLFTMISDVAGDGPKDRAFALISMCRAGAFGTGTLAAAITVSVVGAPALRVALAVNIASFVLAALALAAFVLPDDRGLARSPEFLASKSGTSPVRDQTFMILVICVGLLAVVTDFFLVGLPVYALTVLHTSAWVPGVCLAMLTAATTTLSAVVLRRLRDRSRISALGIAATCYAAWAGLAAVAAIVPISWVPIWLVCSTVVLIGGGLIAGTRANAIAEAAAPPGQRAAYLATFQYAFTIAGLLAPLVVSLFAVATWTPWLTIALITAAGASILPALNRRLPERAVRMPDPRRAANGAARCQWRPASPDR